MTYKRLLQLACDEALRIWIQEKEYLDKCPDNFLAKYKEHVAREEYEQIRTALIAEEEAMSSRA